MTDRLEDTTMGTKQCIMLRNSKADTVGCDQKQFERLGVPFKVAILADAV